MWNIWPFGRKSEPFEQRSMTIDEFLAMAGIPNTGSGEYVSAGTAESLPAVMNAVSVISEAVATMPCYLYRVRNDNGREAREWLSNHPVDFLLFLLGRLVTWLWNLTLMPILSPTKRSP